MWMRDCVFYSEFQWKKWNCHKMENKNHGQSLWIGLQRHFNTAIYAIQGASKKPSKRWTPTFRTTSTKQILKKQKHSIRSYIHKPSLINRQSIKIFSACTNYFYYYLWVSEMIVCFLCILFNVCCLCTLQLKNE